MGIDIVLWRITIGCYITKYRSAKSALQSSIFAHLKCPTFAGCFHLSCIIVIFLTISGIESNPGPQTRNSASTVDTNHDTSVTDALTKILSELASLRHDQQIASQNFASLQASITTRLDTIDSKIQSHDIQLAALQISCNDLNRHLSATGATTASIASSINATPVSTSSAPPNYNDIISEFRNRESRRCNIIISGLQPSANTSDEDLAKLVLNEIHFQSPISSCRRLPSKSASSRPGLLLVTLPNATVCSNIIKSAKVLRRSMNPLFTNVFINPDLTTQQRTEQKRLNDEKRARKSNGEDVIIHRGKVISRPSHT
jgi:hypothetical protein